MFINILETEKNAYAECASTIAALRLSVGWTSTDDEVSDARDRLVDVVTRLRAGAPVAAG